MLKKLLTLSLVAVILSVSAFATPTPMAPMTAALAETDTSAIVTVPPHTALIDDMEFMIATQGASGVTVANYNKGKRVINIGANEWLLAKVYVGENWVLSDTNMTLTTYVHGGATTDMDYMYVTPLTQAQYEAASPAGSGTAVPGLEAPAAAADASKDTATTSKALTKPTFTLSLTNSLYGEANYDGEYLYLAIQYSNTSKITLFTDATYAPKWNLTLDGKKTVPADTATVTTTYISAATGEQTITCNADATNGLTVGKNANWAFCKMDTGYTYNDIVSITLAVPAERVSQYTSTVHVYALTEEEWNAATAGGTRTLNVADKQNLFVSPYGGRTSFAKHNNVDETLTFDLTTRYAESAKSGVIYLCLGYASNDATASREGIIYTPTLTITGTHGEYTAPAVTTLDDSYLAWNGANYSFYTTATSGKAVLIAATFNGTTMVDAEAITLDASTATNGVISGTTTLDAGETLKVYLWEDGTLTPIKNVIEF